MQARFLRRVIEAVERLRPGIQLAQRLQGDAAKLYKSAVLRDLDAVPRTVSLDDAGLLLWSLDSSVDDGSGTLLQHAGQELGNRYFTTAGFQVSDLWSCTQRVGGELVNAFVEYDLEWRVTRREDGLELFMLAPGQPRLARALRHLTVGYLRSAFTFAFEATSIQLRILGNTLGDRVSITARYRSLEPIEAITPPPVSPRRPPSTLPPPSSRSASLGAVSVAEEVDRILRKAPPPGKWSRPRVPR